MADAAALHELLERLGALLSGPARREIVESVLAAGEPDRALARLRRTLTAQRFTAGSATLELERPVRRLDHRTRREGFRVLHSWDHTAHRFTDDMTPVLMLDYLEGDADVLALRPAVSILLDFHFLHLLALCAMRAWDDPDPEGVLDRVTGLVGRLQGPDGSGHRFVDDSETLVIYALSQFHPEEHAYDRLIERIAALGEARQTRFALPSASVLSCHLRWGFWLMYGRDVLRMRNDNVGDYPWLLYSVLTLLREYDRLREAGVEAAGRRRVDVVDGLLQGFAADPWAFTGSPPPALAAYAADYAEMRGLLERWGGDLLGELAGHRPTRGAYAPLSLHFNFPHNTLVALAAMAIRDGSPQTLPLNALFVRDPAEEAGSRETLARALMEYSGASPHRLGWRGAMLVAYDPLSGMRSFTMTVDALRESLPEP